MTKLDVREKAKRIVELFRSRRRYRKYCRQNFTRGISTRLTPFGARFRRLRKRKGGAPSPVTRSGLRRAVMQKTLRGQRTLLRCDLRRRGSSWPSQAGGQRLLSPRGRNRDCISAGRTTCRRAVTLGEIATAVESCMAAIELIEDLHYDYKRLDAAAMVAGNVWNAGVVLGNAGDRLAEPRLGSGYGPALDQWAGDRQRQRRRCDGPSDERARLARGQACGSGNPIAPRDDRHDRQHGSDPISGGR